MSTTQPPTLNFSSTTQTLSCVGEWTLTQEAPLNTVFATLNQLLRPLKTKTLIVNGSQLTQLDSSGIWWLVELFKFCQSRKITFQLQDFSPTHDKLIQLFSEKLATCEHPPAPKSLPWVAALGKTTVAGLHESIAYISFVGEIFSSLMGIIRHPRRLAWRMLLNVIQTAGYHALPITGLLTFLIGIVLAYQMGLQLRNYGANIYVVDLMAISVLREFAPMMTAIIIAGRSGSAFTAQIGTMKVNQEIDALYTLGIKPVERLVAPKLLGLLIALPLLTVWADALGIFGGMLMANNILDIKFSYFIHRFDEVVPLRWYVIGLIKTPVFALLIASIGCFQGLQVEYTADSVGAHTTKSVVQAIFMIITFDAFFSILLSWLKI